MARRTKKLHKLKSKKSTRKVYERIVSNNKILRSLITFVLVLMVSCKVYSQESKKIFLEPISNKIESGSLAGNRNLTFGFKNILLESLQELDYDITDSAKERDYSLKVELLYFDVMENSMGFSVFHKNDNETILKIKGYLYNKDGKKVKDYIATGKSSEISLSTLIISESGSINQTSVSNVLKKASETLIQKLLEK